MATKTSAKGGDLQKSDTPAPLLPRIDISRIPEFEGVRALFGTLRDGARQHSLDDNRVELLDCLYAFHPGT